MRLLLDTNILLDVLAARRPFYDAAARIWSLAEELGFDFIDFAGLGRDDWVMINPPDTRWKSDSYPLGPGFPFARPVLEAGAVVSVCCLKTHANGGGITMSLKPAPEEIIDIVKEWSDLWPDSL